MEKRKLGTASVFPEPRPVLLGYPVAVGYTQGSESFKKVVKLCRQYYLGDSIAGTVIDRLCDLAVTNINFSYPNGKMGKALTQYYKDNIALIKPFLKMMAQEYLISGLVAPAHTLEQKKDGKWYLKDLWVRNVDNLELKTKATSGRAVYLNIPTDDIKLIQTEGKPDRVAEYQQLLATSPEYVQQIKSGTTKILLDTHVLLRKPTSFQVYPIPYLQNALAALEYKARLKQADAATAKRVIEAIRHFKVGDKDYPADDEMIGDEKRAFTESSTGDTVANYFTNHTIQISWVYPPLDALLSDQKYIAANLEIFFALGFPRIWLNGETEKSNTADNALATVGPLATIRDIQDQLLSWVRYILRVLADKNGFTKVPEVSFAAVNLANMEVLVQYAKDYYEVGALSLDDLAKLYGSNFEKSFDQRKLEESVLPKPEPIEPVAKEEIIVEEEDQGKETEE